MKYFKYLFSSTFILLFTSIVTLNVFAQQSTLEDAKTKYQFAEYGEASELFEKVVSNSDSDIELRREALRYQARAYIAQRNKSEARSAIEELVETGVPKDYLDPDVEPPAIMEIYYEVQKEKTGSYEAADKGLQTIAIMDFSNNSITNRSKYEGLRKGLPSLMTHRMTDATDLQVVERERIEWLLNEIELQERKDRVDQSTAVQTGKLLGANAVVFGHFITTQELMSISARVVDVETGEVLFGEQVRGESDNFFNLIENLSQKITKSVNVQMEETKLGSEQTRSLDAMMAYSDGLNLLEAGKYYQAEYKFKKALKHDENFEKAKKKLESLKPMVASNN